MEQTLSYPLPKDESLRLQALYDYAILDTMSEEDYNSFTKIAAQICQVPGSLITFLDKDRQWFKSHLGVDITETPREFSFCNYTIMDPGQVLVVPDLREDSRFAANPLVTNAPHAVFYAGAPLVTPEGFALGSICVLDDKVNNLTVDQIDTLKALAKQIVTKLELKKKLKELTLTQQTLKQANKNLKGFAKIVSHDMKTPLANISLVSRSFQITYARHLNTEANGFFELINRSVTELLVFIDQILIQSNSISELSPNGSGADAAVVLEHVIQMLALPPDVEIKTDGCFPSVQINKTALQQIFQNLLSNAIKYSDKPKTQIFVSAESIDDYVYFKIADNGMGIQKKNLVRIFRDRQTLDRTDRYGNKGTGIGLATVKGLVESSGGNITVESDYKQGSVFTFSVPCLPTAAEK